MADQQEHSETLTIRYESDAHRADAKAVGSGLLALQCMIEEVRLACDDNEDMLVKARPFARGSLEVPVDLIVFGAAILLQEYPLFQKIRDVIAQYFDIKRRLKGQPIHVEDGNVILIENSRIHIDQITLQFLDPGSDVSRRCSEAFQAIEADSEIKAVAVSSRMSNEPLVRVERNDFRYFHPDIPSAEQNLGQQYEESRETLVIRQPAFESELAWRFIWNGIKIQAKVQHEEFQKRVEAGQESFVAGDSLDVTLRRLQEYDPASGAYADKQYTITNVWGHNRRAKGEQANLFD